jgi:predicted 2-oxoglutarate/Fe(II)-dependent dioxygenase YbiX
VHSFEFFRRLGFYCTPDFLGHDARVALFRQIHGSTPLPAEVLDGRPDPIVDMAVRNTWEVPVDGAAELGDRLGALRAELADHFKLPLDGHEGPTCLMYQPGGFYEPHVDRSKEGLKISAARRRVSVVIFLNAMRTPPGRDDYSGGALTFYGVVDDPAWRSFGFGLAPEPGLLVAFPSHVIHEVTPVTAGDRYTIVDWFTG